MKNQWINESLPAVIHYPLMVVGIAIGLVLIWTMVAGPKGDQ